ncbi:hypothetical protein AAG570_009225 [Ranatra chinensis]|uniref:PAZ domain-containing protein n=1 Tax=Ranatra chinensis TaxID=642074 RepID=A0ABD0YTG6_9HEMI
MRRILTSREKRGRGGTASAADISRSVSSIMEDGNLDPVTMSALRGFLKGLKVTYMLPSQPDTSRAYLINDLADSALRTKSVTLNIIPTDVFPFHIQAMVWPSYGQPDNSFIKNVDKSSVRVPSNPFVDVQPKVVDMVARRNRDVVKHNRGTGLSSNRLHQEWRLSRRDSDTERWLEWDVKIQMSSANVARLWCFSRFKLATGQEVSVNDFFRKDKNYCIKYPNMPCLHVGPVKRSICLPAELCTISAGQAMTRKLNENQIRQMVTNAARPAYERKAKILDSMRLVDMDNDKCISHFGIKVSTEFEKVPARVLQAPILGYSSAVCPKDGTWRAEKFATSVTLTNWSIINIDDRTSREQVDFVASELQSLGPHHGLRVGRPDIIDVKEFKRGINSAKTVLAQLFRQQKADEKQIVLIIMASSGEHYGIVH